MKKSTATRRTRTTHVLRDGARQRNASDAGEGKRAADDENQIDWERTDRRKLVDEKKS